MNRSRFREPLTWLMALQWIGVVVPVSASIAFVNADALDMGATEMGGYVARALAFFGAFTVLQLIAGHRMPSFEGPATITLAAIIFAVQTTRETSTLGTVAAGLLGSAVVLMMMSLTGALRPVARIYTPFVNGVFLILLTIAVLWAVLPQAVRSEPPWGAIVPTVALAAVVLTSIFLEIWGRGTWKTLSLLVGFLVGLVVFVVGGGLAPPVEGVAAAVDVSLVRPDFEADVFFPVATVGVLVAMNSLGTGGAVARACSEPLHARHIERGLLVTSLSHAVQGVIPGSATVPHAESAVLAGRAPSVARESLLLGCTIMGVAALVPATSAGILRIPPALSHDLLVAVMVSLGLFGITELRRVEWSRGRAAVLGGSVTVCILLIPGPPPWLPGVLAYLALSPILTGMAVALVGEAILLRRDRRLPGSTASGRVEASR